MPDAKFESGSFSIFGGMMSQNFPLNKGKSEVIKFRTPLPPAPKIRLTFRKWNIFISRIILLHPKLPPCQLQQFSSRGNFLSFSNIFRRLDEKKTAATPLMNQFC